MKVIRNPITACTECTTAYDLGQWHELARCEPDAERQAKLKAHSGEMAERAEWRRCGICAHKLVLVVTDELRSEDVYVPADAYQQAWPYTRRRIVDKPAKEIAAGARGWLRRLLGRS